MDGGELKRVAWRVIIVFVSAMLVDVSANDFVSAASSLKFWQDVSGAAIVAFLSEIIELARIHGGAAVGAATGKKGDDA